MNDIILSSFLNLFALMGARNGVDKQTAADLVQTYLTHYYGIRNNASYVNLHSDLRDYYDDFQDLDKDAIIDGICSKLVSQISKEEQCSMLLRLLEFCKIGGGAVSSEDEIFLKIKELFVIDDRKYATYCNYVDGMPDDDVWVQPLWGGVLKAMYERDINKLVFTLEGDISAQMNDVPVFNGIFQTWPQSGVLKGTGPKALNAAPMYYSTIMALFSEVDMTRCVELCGRHIEYRFEPGGNNGMHDFSFNLEGGTLVAIMGGSGVGKTTLLSLLNGSLKPQSGTITINGHDISEPEAKALIGFVPQDDLLIEELTVYQNLWYTARLCFADLSDEEIDKRVLSVLGQLGLMAAKDLKVGSPINKFISGGQRKRVNIALELLREPAILFLDEPTSGLSSSDTEKVINLLKEQTGKGRLIIANIHQPSSDVYKLFDRLWLLDKGGYPIFDGNPIAALPYFKKAANYADANTSTCPVCGNVNPEIVLNIIDETGLDSKGNRTGNRKITPQEWHELYLDSRPEMETVEVMDVPETDQKRPSRFKQMLIFFERNLKAKLTDIQYVAVTLLEAPLLALISAVLTHFTPSGAVYSVMENKNLPSYLFMAVIVCTFLGMSGSAEEIIKDRAILKREKFLNLSHGGYIWSKMLYMALVCMVQTFLFTITGNLIMGIHGMLGVWWLLLFVTAFLSSLIGLLLSQSLDSVVSIYISIPLLLIPQILLCGLVVHFEDLNPGSKTGNVPLIGEVIPSRWSYEALAVASFSMNDYKEMSYDLDCERFTCQYYERQFIHELKTQLEIIEDARIKGKELDGSNMARIRKGLSQLDEECGMDKYSGDFSYQSLYDYLDAAARTLSDRGNRITLDIDAKMVAIAREKGTEALKQLKRDNYNLQLENLMVGLNSDKLYKIVDDRIVPSGGFVYLRPMSRNGRAPFYSGVKVIGDRDIPTYWYNLLVLLLMCVLVSACLFCNFPEKIAARK